MPCSRLQNLSATTCAVMHINSPAIIYTDNLITLSILMQSQTVFNSQPKTLVIHWQTSFVYMNTAHASDAGPGEMLTLWSGPSAPESCHEQKN